MTIRDIGARVLFKRALVITLLRMVFILPCVLLVPDSSPWIEVPLCLCIGFISCFLISEKLFDDMLLWAGCHGVHVVQAPPDKDYQLLHKQVQAAGDATTTLMPIAVCLKKILAHSEVTMPADVRAEATGLMEKAYAESRALLAIMAESPLEEKP